MIQRTLSALALLALPLAAMLAMPGRALGQQGESVIINADAHKLADQEAAITYARELIAAGEMDRAAEALAEFVATHPDATEAARFLGDSIIVKVISIRRKPCTSN